MAYTTIDNPGLFFNTVLYTGDLQDSDGTGHTQSITGVGFQPDWVWLKPRSDADNHVLFDSSRGALKSLHSNLTNSESTDSNALTSFDSDGFTLNDWNNINENSQTYVSWNWKANGGTTSSNSDGTITSTVQANTTAGFSIVTFTGNGVNGSTVGH